MLKRVLRFSFHFIMAAVVVGMAASIVDPAAGAAPKQRVLIAWPGVIASVVGSVIFTCRSRSRAPLWVWVPCVAVLLFAGVVEFFRWNPKWPGSTFWEYVSQQYFGPTEGDCMSTECLYALWYVGFIHSAVYSATACVVRLMRAKTIMSASVV